MSWDRGVSGHFKVLLADLVAACLKGELGEDICRDTGSSIAVEAEPYGRTDLRAVTLEAPTGPSSREALARILAEVEQHASCPSSKDDQDGVKNVRVKVAVPRWLASTLIGYRGMNIKDICRSTGTLIHVEQWTTGEGESVEQVANVSGCVENILEVFARIHKYHADRGDGAVKEGRPKGLPSPPSPWQLEEHPDALGEFYYLNTETGETTWDLPEDPGDNTGSERGAGATEAGRAPKSVPPPWIALEHPEAPGEWYLLNEETGETTWELPGAAPADKEPNAHPARSARKRDSSDASRGRRRRDASPPVEKAPKPSAVGDAAPQPEAPRRDALRRRRPVQTPVPAPPAAEVIDGLIDAALAAAAMSAG